MSADHLLATFQNVCIFLLTFLVEILFELSERFHFWLLLSLLLEWCIYLTLLSCHNYFFVLSFMDFYGLFEIFLELLDFFVHLIKAF